MTTLTINDSDVPVVRAGSSNLVWPIIAIALFMLVRAADLPTSGQLIVSIFLLLTIALGIRLFATTLAKVTFLDDAIDVMLAVSKRKIRYEQIEFVELTRMRLTPLLRIRIKSKNSADRLQLAVRGPFTPWGTLNECSSRFRKLLEEKGVRVTEK